jgi:hypothetical protein
MHEAGSARSCDGRLADSQARGLRGGAGRARVAVRSGTPGVVPACGAPLPPARWLRASPSPPATSTWPGREGLRPSGTGPRTRSVSPPDCESGRPVRPGPFGACQCADSLPLTAQERSAGTRTKARHGNRGCDGKRPLRRQGPARRWAFRVWRVVREVAGPTYAARRRGCDGRGGGGRAPGRGRRRGDRRVAAPLGRSGFGEGHLARRRAALHRRFGRLRRPRRPAGRRIGRRAAGERRCHPGHDHGGGTGLLVLHGDACGQRRHPVRPDARRGRLQRRWSRR